MKDNNMTDNVKHKISALDSDVSSELDSGKSEILSIDTPTKSSSIVDTDDNYSIAENKKLKKKTDSSLLNQNSIYIPPRTTPLKDLRDLSEKLLFQQKVISSTTTESDDSSEQDKEREHSSFIMTFNIKKYNALTEGFLNQITTKRSKKNGDIIFFTPAKINEFLERIFRMYANFYNHQCATIQCHSTMQLQLTKPYFINFLQDIQLLQSHETTEEKLQHNKKDQRHIDHNYYITRQVAQTMFNSCNKNAEYMYYGTFLQLLYCLACFIFRRKRFLTDDEKMNALIAYLVSHKKLATRSRVYKDEAVCTPAAAAATEVIKKEVKNKSVYHRERPIAISKPSERIVVKESLVEIHKATTVPTTPKNKHNSTIKIQEKKLPTAIPKAKFLETPVQAPTSQQGKKAIIKEFPVKEIQRSVKLTRVNQSLFQLAGSTISNLTSPQPIGSTMSLLKSFGTPTDNKAPQSFSTQSNTSSSSESTKSSVFEQREIDYLEKKVYNVFCMFSDHVRGQTPLLSENAFDNLIMASGLDMDIEIRDLIDVFNFIANDNDTNNSPNDLNVIDFLSFKTILQIIGQTLYTSSDGYDDDEATYRVIRIYFMPLFNWLKKQTTCHTTNTELCNKHMLLNDEALLSSYYTTSQQPYTSMLPYITPKTTTTISKNIDKNIYKPNDDNQFIEKMNTDDYHQQQSFQPPMEHIYSQPQQKNSDSCAIITTPYYIVDPVNNSCIIDVRTNSILSGFRWNSTTNQILGPDNLPLKNTRVLNNQIEIIIPFIHYSSNIKIDNENKIKKKKLLHRFHYEPPLYDPIGDSIGSRIKRNSIVNKDIGLAGSPIETLFQTSSHRSPLSIINPDILDIRNYMHDQATIEGYIYPPQDGHYISSASMNFNDVEDWNQEDLGDNYDLFHDFNNDLTSQHERHHHELDQSIIPVPEESVDLPLDFEVPEPQVQNVIASVNLTTELHLRRIAISARNAEYNPTKVNAVVLRLRNPKCTGLLFRSGRIMVTGAKSVDDAKIGGKKMAKLCLKVGHPEVRFRGFRIENIIAAADVGFPIRLEGLAHDHASFCNYEPELFSGLVYRYNQSDAAKAVLLVFVSGKIIITGCQNSDIVKNIMRTMLPVFAQYRK